MRPSTKFVLDMIREHRREMLVIVAIATVGAVLATIVPYVYGKLFDLAQVPSTPVSLLLALIGIWLLMSLISAYTSNKTGLLGEVLGAKMSLKAEVDAYSHFLTLPVLFHKREQRGEVLQKITRGAWRLQNMVESLADVLPRLLMFAFSVVAMSLIEWRLALLLLLSFLIYGLVTVRMTEEVLKARRREHKVFEKQYGKVYDKLYNVFLVKNFVMEDKEKDRFTKALIHKTLPALKESSAKSARLSILQGVIYSVAFVSVLGTAIFFLRHGNISAGEFVMFFGYVNLAFGPFRFLAALYRRYRRSVLAISRFVRLKRIAPEVMKHGKKTLPNLRGEIEFENLSFSYVRGKYVLKDINLKINAGESVALVGKSGVGKSTLSELILGYYKPKKGTIKLDGVPIQKLSLKWLRRQIAIVPQDLSLFNDTLINNIRYANPKASYEEVVEAAKAAAAHEFIENLPKGYYTKVGEEGVKLSMGQRQRIAITMAFLKNPRILILDEPTAALDAESEKKVQQGIERLIKGKTTIIIAHRFSTVRKADKIVVLDKGRIAELGNHNDLMRKKGLYYRYYTLQKGKAR